MLGKIQLIYYSMMSWPWKDYILAPLFSILQFWSLKSNILGCQTPLYYPWTFNGFHSTAHSSQHSTGGCPGGSCWGHNDWVPTPLLWKPLWKHDPSDGAEEQGQWEWWRVLFGVPHPEARVSRVGLWLHVCHLLHGIATNRGKYC